MSILIVEDSVTQSDLLKNRLEEHTEEDILQAFSGNEALSLAMTNKPSLIISDIIMPEMDGFELCRKVKADKSLRNIPLILLTALSDTEAIVKSLECGADVFFTKPLSEIDIKNKVLSFLKPERKIHRRRFPPNDHGNGVKITVGKNDYLITAGREQILNLLLLTHETSVRNNHELKKAQHDLRVLNQHLETLVAERTKKLTSEISRRKKAEKDAIQNLDKLRKNLASIIEVLYLTIETRDPYTSGHQKRVANLARSIAKEMNFSTESIDNLRMAATIHDLGKMSVPAEILSKPAKLTAIEFSLIKVHPQAGYDILQKSQLPYPIAHIVLQHHERLDGSGYPQGLKGDAILLDARILAVADVVEAIASHRPYREALGIETALEEIEKNKGVLYDSNVVDTTLKLFREKGFEF